MSAKNKQGIVQSIQAGDEKQVLKLLQESMNSFNVNRRRIIGMTVTALPLMMAIKVPE